MITVPIIQAKIPSELPSLINIPIPEIHRTAKQAYTIKILFAEATDWSSLSKIKNRINHIVTNLCVYF